MSPRIEQYEDEIDEAKPVRNDKCPVDGCDSTGHINGIKEKHFLAESCPFFHNMTKEGFQADLADLFMIRSNERNRAMIGQHRRKKENLNRVASMIHIDYESVSKRIKIV